MSQYTCAGCLNTTAEISSFKQCPLCQAEGRDVTTPPSALNKAGYFCSQECFAKNWLKHRDTEHKSGIVKVDDKQKRAKKVRIEDGSSQRQTSKLSKKISVEERTRHLLLNNELYLSGFWPLIASFADYKSYGFFNAKSVGKNAQLRFADGHLPSGRTVINITEGPNGSSNKKISAAAMWCAAVNIAHLVKHNVQSEKKRRFVVLAGTPLSAFAAAWSVNCYTKALLTGNATHDIILTAPQDPKSACFTHLQILTPEVLTSNSVWLESWGEKDVAHEPVLLVLPDVANGEDYQTLNCRAIVFQAATMQSEPTHVLDLSANLAINNVLPNTSPFPTPVTGQENIAKVTTIEESEENDPSSVHYMTSAKRQDRHLINKILSAHRAGHFDNVLCRLLSNPQLFQLPDFSERLGDLYSTLSRNKFEEAVLCALLCFRGCISTNIVPSQNNQRDDSHNSLSSLIPGFNTAPSAGNNSTTHHLYALLLRYIYDFNAKPGRLPVPDLRILMNVLSKCISRSAATFPLNVDPSLVQLSCAVPTNCSSPAVPALTLMATLSYLTPDLGTLVHRGNAMNTISNISKQNSRRNSGVLHKNSESVEIGANVMYVPIDIIDKLARSWGISEIIPGGFAHLTSTAMCPFPRIQQDVARRILLRYSISPTGTRGAQFLVVLYYLLFGYIAKHAAMTVADVAALTQWNLGLQEQFGNLSTFLVTAELVRPRNAGAASAIARSGLTANAQIRPGDVTENTFVSADIHKYYGPNCTAASLVREGFAPIPLSEAQAVKKVKLIKAALDEILSTLPAETNLPLYITTVGNNIGKWSAFSARYSSSEGSNAYLESNSLFFENARERHIFNRLYGFRDSKISSGLRKKADDCTVIDNYGDANLLESPKQLEEQEEYINNVHKNTLEAFLRQFTPTYFSLVGNVLKRNIMGTSAPVRLRYDDHNDGGDDSDAEDVGGKRSTVRKSRRAEKKNAKKERNRTRFNKNHKAFDQAAKVPGYKKPSAKKIKGRGRKQNIRSWKRTSE